MVGEKGLIMQLAMFIPTNKSSKLNIHLLNIYDIMSDNISFAYIPEMPIR